jgi:hypothetical protein
MLVINRNKIALYTYLVGFTEVEAVLFVFDGMPEMLFIF